MYSSLQCIHERAVHRGRQWRVKISHLISEAYLAVKIWVQFSLQHLVRLLADTAYYPDGYRALSLGGWVRPVFKRTDQRNTVSRYRICGVTLPLSPPAPILLLRSIHSVYSVFRIIRRTLDFVTEYQTCALSGFYAPQNGNLCRERTAGVGSWNMDRMQSIGKNWRP